MPFEASSDLEDQIGQMMEIPATNAAVGSLFDERIPNSPMLFSVLAGRNPGRVLVDDVETPSQAVLSNNEGWLFPGSSVSESFLEDAIRVLGRTGDVAMVTTSEAARRGTMQLPAVNVIHRVEFVGRDEDWAGFRALLEPVRPKIELRDMDLAILKQCTWRSNVESACGSLENFLRHGLGLCLLMDGTIITEAYAPFWGNDTVEIGAVTNAEFRGNGYAAVACAHLIERCERLGKEVCWSCDVRNSASLRTAEKLGLRFHQAYDLWIYRPADRSDRNLG